ncbi:hypothetical protein CYLTODRAFT_417519 [Cylindrobasidium torrendii FP15055 ss-10]|uniref:DNA replication checkpoint mediator MRC1 domain-containing protein n=1 Tax=Cylindrobasidium torrendii FP15055 ss-10 TaxID=1314674 RepID=A0A0D7BR37_9AGAR|nr:hypothetical protein CYLTODRAFT_417519 [Cylindrobasidium torrendii FP15055 ss-10]
MPVQESSSITFDHTTTPPPQDAGSKRRRTYGRAKPATETKLMETPAGPSTSRLTKSLSGEDIVLETPQVPREDSSPVLGGIPRWNKRLDISAELAAIDADFDKDDAPAEAAPREDAALQPSSPSPAPIPRFSPPSPDSSPAKGPPTSGSDGHESPGSPILRARKRAPRRVREESPTPAEPTRARRSLKGKGSIKPLPKKELRLMEEEQTRMTIAKDTTVPRKQTRLFTPANLLKALQQKKPVAELDSDPIRNDSSPSVAAPTPFAGPSGPRSTFPESPSASRLEDFKPLISDHDDEDEDLPDSGQLHQQNKDKRQLEERKKLLQARKAAAVAARQQQHMSDDDDSEIEVVADSRSGPPAAYDEDEPVAPKRKLTQHAQYKLQNETLLQKHERQVKEHLRQKQEAWRSMGGSLREEQATKPNVLDFVKTALEKHEKNADNEDPSVDEEDEDVDYIDYEEMEMGDQTLVDQDVDSGVEEDESEDENDENENQEGGEADEDNEDENVAPKRTTTRRRRIVDDDEDEGEGDKENDENQENGDFSPRPLFNQPASLSFSASRTPLAELETPAKTKSASFMERLQLSGSRRSPSPGGSPAPFNFGGPLEFSQSGSQATLAGSPGLAPGFGDLFADGTQASPKKPGLNKADTFDRLFGARKDVTVLGLTQDAEGLEPAFEAEPSLKRKADKIFEEEQEYLARQGMMDAPEEKGKRPLYINDNGFLTQTRPENSPALYTLTPSQRAHPFTPSGTQRNSERTPLGLLSSRRSPDSASDSGSPSWGRLRRRGSTSIDSPSPSKKRRTVVPPVKPMIRKSDFIEGEAEEEDDEDDIGFGARSGAAAGDDEEEEGGDLDRELEVMMDRRNMTEEEAAEALVREKFKEDEREDDAKIQREVQAIIEGRRRNGRRRRPIGFEDDDDDADNYDDIEDKRRRMKMQRAEPQNIQELYANEATAAFARAYKHQEDEVLDFPKSDGIEPEDLAQDDDDEMDVDGPRERVDFHTLRRELQQTARMDEDEDGPAFDPNVVPGDDDDDDDDLHIRVKTVDTKAEAARRRANTREFDEFAPGSSTGLKDKNPRNAAWAKTEGKMMKASGSRPTNTTSRSSIVTGHGSFTKGARVTEKKKEEKRKPPVRAPGTSILKKTLSGRQDRFTSS